MSRIRYAIAAGILASTLCAQSPAPPAADSGTPAPPAATPPPDSTVLVITKKVKPDYPAAALPEKLQGQVVVRIVVDEDGDVESTEVISGNPVLAQSAVDAVKQWKFRPFIRNGQPVKAGIKLPFDFAPPVDAPDAGGQPKVVTRQAMPVKPDDEDLGPAPLGVVRVPQVVTKGMLVYRVSPDYPAPAKPMHLQGSVTLAAIISKDGTIKNLRVVSGHPMLAQAAVDAVKQWRYRPYLLNGEPTEVQTTVVVTFSLNESRVGTGP